MTAEGTFPKSDGDVLYASEANNFGKTLWGAYSGTDIDFAIIANGSTLTSGPNLFISGNIMNQASYISFTGSIYSNLNVDAASGKIEIMGVASGATDSILFQKTLVSANTAGTSNTTGDNPVQLDFYGITPTQRTEGLNFRLYMSGAAGDIDGGGDFVSGTVTNSVYRLEAFK